MLGSPRYLFQSCTVIVAALLLIACNVNSDSSSRTGAAVPFNYEEGEELRTGMQQLAYELQLLDWYLLNEEDEQVDLQQEVVDSMNTIEEIAVALQDNEISANHHFLYDDMERFLSDVRRARASANSGDSRLVLSSRVVSACMECHRENR